MLKNFEDTIRSLVNLEKFSYDKKLFDYQVEAVLSSMNILLNWFEKRENVINFYNSRHGNERLHIKFQGRAKEILLKEGYKFSKDFLPLDYIANRASIWMATGSGKTLVIVKLIEALKIFMRKNIIPKADILFLTSRDDLIEQFLKHLEDFNQSKANKIYAHNIRDYEKVKAGISRFTDGSDVNIFYYRSDLLSDEDKDKIINYEKFPRNWYIILDEAHKGSRTDSKRQAIFTALSKNGFMFSFSATFTDPVDHITCVYNFNLKELVSQGYGKRIALLKSDTKALTDRKAEYSREEKQKVLLKTLILFTLIKKARKKLDFYHNPMMLVLGNSVNTEESDLELFFRELSSVALGKVSEKAFTLAFEELKSDLSKFKYAFENDEESLTVDFLTVKDILSEVFNADGFGNIEIIKIPNNSQELLFKHVASNKPFMLLKIGDVSKWLTEKLEGYNIINTFLSQSVFRNLNDHEKSSINILLGSRAFYEGWDSSRPNIILYLTVGSSDAKKFVLQSLGRGVRIEVKGQRKRLTYVDREEYEKLKNYADYLESLFVFGTKIKDIQTIVDSLEIIDITGNNVKRVFPVSFEKRNSPSESFNISREDLKLLRCYCEHLGPKILLLKYDLSVKALKLLLESLREPEKYFNFTEKSIEDIDILMGKFILWLNRKVAA